MSIHGNVIGLISLRADWAEQDPKKASFIENKPVLEYMMAPSSAVTFQYSTTRNVALISCRASQGSGHAVVLYSGYGSGGSIRSSATILSGGGNILCSVTPEGTGNGVTIWNEINVSCSVSVLQLLGALPSAIEGAATSTKPADAGNTHVDKAYVDKTFAPNGHGLGGFTGGACADCNTAITNGWYNINSETANPPTVNGVTHNIATLFVVARASRVWQTAYSNTSSVHAILQRTSWNSGASWNEWEWVNPPMSVGVEYRTTERYQGVAVYKKVDSDGNILWRKNGDTKWRLMSAATYVATATVE